MVTFIETDEWGRKIYKAESGNKYVDLNGELYTLTEEGEPCWPTGRKTADYIKPDSE